MSERLGIKLRRLPDGPSLNVFEVCVNGHFLELDLAGADVPVGALVEIERGSLVYLGELQQRQGQTATVQVEHTLDITRLKPIREMWG
jgi:hypothetical protein